MLLTVIVQEVATPLPPVYPYPLIYTIHTTNPTDKDAVLHAVAVARAADIGWDDVEEIKAGLQPLFAFPLDTRPWLGWRE